MKIAAPPFYSDLAGSIFGNLIFRGLVFALILANSVLLILHSVHAQDEEPGTKLKQNQTEHKVAGKVVDTDGKPIRDAIVCLQVLESGVGMKNAETRSTADGRFELDYTHLIKRPADRADSYLWIATQDHELKCVRPELSPVGKLDLRITMKQAKPLHVNVSGTTGDSIVEPYLMSVPNGVFDSDRETGLSTLVPDSIRSALSRKLDANGNTFISGLSSKWISRFRVTNGDGLDYDFSRTDTGQFQFAIPASGTLRVRIKNYKETEKQFAWVSSTLNECETSRKCEIGLNGEFTVQGLIPGKATVNLKWNPKSHWQPEPIEYPIVVANETTDFEISLVRGTTIIGQLLTEDTREPIDSAKIWVECSREFPSTGTHYHLEPDKEGRIFAHLAPGEWTLQVYSIGDWVKNYEHPPFIKFNVPYEKEKIDLGVIALSSRATETGKVVDTIGSPIANRWIAYITPSHGHSSRSAKTDSSGNFTAKTDGRLNKEPDARWVIYPHGAKPGSVDARTLPTLKVMSTKPWELVLQE